MENGHLNEQLAQHEDDLGPDKWLTEKLKAAEETVEQQKISISKFVERLARQIELSQKHKVQILKEKEERNEPAAQPDQSMICLTSKQDAWLQFDKNLKTYAYDTKSEAEPFIGRL
jgi:hypothetical protein